MTPRRITHDGAGTEYPTVQAYNANCSRFLLLRPPKPGAAFDHFALFSADGKFLRDLPIGASQRPRWSTTDGNLFYFLEGNQIKSYNVGSSNVGVVKTFGEYSVVDNLGEGDISPDGTCLGLIGDDRQVFVYDLALKVKGRALNVAVGSVESIYLDSQNNVLLSSSGRDGMDLFDRCMNFQRKISPVNSHKIITRNAAGDDCLLWCCANDPVMNCNGIVVTTLKDGVHRIIHKLDWSLALHFSRPEAPGWSMAEAYSMAGGPEVPYRGQLLKIALDGSPIEVICDHGSVIEPTWSGEDRYLAQPKSTVSRDGKRVLFSSNVADPRPGVVDVCEVEIPQVIPSVPASSRTDAAMHGRKAS